MDLKSSSETCYFEDGTRKIDFILVYKSRDEQHSKKCSNFHQQLIESGLELEAQFNETNSGTPQLFIKVHAPDDVLLRYADAYGLHMPIIENDIEITRRTKRLFQPRMLLHIAFLRGLHRLFIRYANTIITFFDHASITEPTPYFCSPFSLSRRSQFICPDEKGFFSENQRIWIVWEILKRANIDESYSMGKVGIHKLLSDKVYSAAYPLHDGSIINDYKEDGLPTTLHQSQRFRLYNSWANPKHCYRHQPLDAIRHYLGDQVGVYFAFLGFYTKMLIFPAIVGFIVFIYGVTSGKDDIVSMEVCDKSQAGSIIMCPICDRTCEYQYLVSNCFYARLTHVFSNYGTVIFGIFSALWANIFMSAWERKERIIRFHWDMEGFERSEQVRPEFEVTTTNYKLNSITKKVEPYMTLCNRFKKTFYSFSIVLLMLTLTCGTTLGVITYRIILTQVYSGVEEQPLINQYAKLVASLTGSMINLVIIVILDVIYFYLAQKLTDWENHRTASEHEKSLTFKHFAFQSVNYYSAIVYIAFIKGQITGRPGAYHRIFGLRSEECDFSGCFIELTVLCSTVMIGKQVFALVYEVLLYPWILGPILNHDLIKNFTLAKFKKEISDRISWCKRARIHPSKNGETRYKPFTRWQKDYELESLPEYGLLYEYLEVAIQYGFVTLFASAFPLAPLMALINNVIEIQVDSYKMLVRFRRPHIVRIQGIGIWVSIIKGISYLSIITNGCIIALTSDAMDKLLYSLSHCHRCEVHEHNSPMNSFPMQISQPYHRLDGYVSYRLSEFNVKDFEYVSVPLNNGSMTFGAPVHTCFYRAFRELPSSAHAYEYTKEFWHLLAIKLTFVLCFEQFVAILSSVITASIASFNHDLKEQKARSNFLSNEAVHELEKERNRQRIIRKKRNALKRINMHSPDD